MLTIFDSCFIAKFLINIPSEMFYKRMRVKFSILYIFNNLFFEFIFKPPFHFQH